MAAALEIPEFYLVNQVVSRLAPDYLNLARLQELIFLLALSIILVSGKNSREISEGMVWNRKNGILVGFLAVWCLLSLQGVTTFLYFKF